MQLYLRMRDGRSRPVLRRSAWAKAASRLNFVNIRNLISQRKENWLKKARLQEPWFSINQRRFISSRGAILGGTLRHGDQQVKKMQLLLHREANRYQASSFNLILQVSAPNNAMQCNFKSPKTEVQSYLSHSRPEESVSKSVIGPLHAPPCRPWPPSGGRPPYSR